MEVSRRRLIVKCAALCGQEIPVTISRPGMALSQKRAAPALFFLGLAMAFAPGELYDTRAAELREAVARAAPSLEEAGVLSVRGDEMEDRR